MNFFLIDKNTHVHVHTDFFRLPSFFYPLCRRCLFSVLIFFSWQGCLFFLLLFLYSFDFLGLGVPFFFFFLSLFFFFTYSGLGSNAASLFIYLFIFISFDFLGPRCVGFFLTRRYFFFGTWFFFFLIINLGDCSFLWLFVTFFCFNWSSFFSNGIWVNLFKLIFSFLPLFHFQPNKRERIKIILSSHFFILSPFSILPLFHHSNQTNPKIFFLFVERGEGAWIDIRW